jgi:dihydrofolate reductase
VVAIRKDLSSRTGLGWWPGASTPAINGRAIFEHRIDAANFPAHTFTPVRKIRIFAHISLDGVIAPPGDSDFAKGEWQAPYRTPAGAEAVAEAQGKGFDLLLGRRTYDLWAGYWPKMKGGPFADDINAATKYVATHRPDSLGWGPVKDLGADIVQGVRGIKSKDGPDLIVWGSSTLTSVLLGQGLVDEVVLLVYPVLLGGANASLRTMPTRANSPSSARRPRRRACS